MEKKEISERLAVQIAMGLLSDDVEGDELTKLAAKARRIGLTGAEIGAARVGRSFDIRDSVAMALSRAYRDGEADAINLQEARAIDAGLSEAELRLIRGLVDAHVSSHTPSRVAAKVK